MDLSHLHHGDVTEAVALAVAQAGALADLARMGDFPGADKLVVSTGDLLYAATGDARELLTRDPARFRGHGARQVAGIHAASWHEAGLALAVAVLHAAYNATDTLLWSRVLAGDPDRFPHDLIGKRWAEAAPRLAEAAPEFDADELAALVRSEGQPSGAAEPASVGNGEPEPDEPQPDGPDDLGGFWWKGNRIDGLTGKPLRVVVYLWGRRQRRARASDVLNEVWGMGLGTESALNTAITRARRALENTPIELSNADRVVSLDVPE